MTARASAAASAAREAVFMAVLLGWGVWDGTSRVSGGAAAPRSPAAGRDSVCRAAARSCRACARPGCSATSDSAWRTALETPSTTGTGSWPRSERARPASGAPASTMTSAPSSATQRSASAPVRSPWSPCTLPMSASGSSSAADAGQPAVEAIGLHRFAVPGADALRDRDDREALAEQAGAGQRRFGEAGHRAGQHLAQRRQAGVAEGGDDHARRSAHGVRPASCAAA